MPGLLAAELEAKEPPCVLTDRSHAFLRVVGSDEAETIRGGMAFLQTPSQDSLYLPL